MTFSEPFRDGNRAHCAPGSVIGLCRRLSGPRIINTFVSLVWFDALSNTRCLAQFQTMLHNPLHNVTVATRSGHTVETYRQFKADIDHLFAQFLPDNSSRTKRDSVAIPLDHCACSPFMRFTAAHLPHVMRSTAAHLPHAPRTVGRQILNALNGGTDS